jgi:holin-like protein
LVSTAGVLLKYLGLLFVPAGVGVIANLSLIGAEWFPIVVGLVGSTILSVLATAYVMRWFSSRNQDSGSAKPLLNGNKMHGTQS